ncbi:hypothetical protein [Vulcanisaeta distributa]|uniref:hypothetical protein n=1 Tax=Vulcanisaeta distributa TaxID=164451 RepID=UPI0006D06AF7|nr:hypothetical protein [Vulcanisaeta distributa]
MSGKITMGGRPVTNISQKELLQKLAQRQAQAKPGEDGKKEKRRGYRDSFDDDYLNRTIVITMDDGKAVTGQLIAYTKFWLKVVTTDGKLVYINKGYVKTIEPQPEAGGQQ